MTETTDFKGSKQKTMDSWHRMYNFPQMVHCLWIVKKKNPSYTFFMVGGGGGWGGVIIKKTLLSERGKQK